MMRQVCLTLSVSAVIAALAYIFLRGKNKERPFAPINVMMCAVFAADTLIFVPIYYEIFKNGAEGILLYWKTILISLYNAVQLFVLNSDFAVIEDGAPQAGGLLYYAYTFYAVALFLLSPMMTFGFVFSFFKNISARRRLIRNYNKDAFVFSDFNEESIESARSIREKFGKCVIVFTNASENAPAYSELIEKAKGIRAVVFEKDISALNFMRHSKKREINFMLLGGDEDVNVNTERELAKYYKRRKNTLMYVLSNGVEGELLLCAANAGEIKIRRISNIRAAVYGILQNSGANLFADAAFDEASGKKLISAVLVGLGKYGGMMARSLAWFCQMEGYRIEIDVFDKNSAAVSAFTDACPELTDEMHNNRFDDSGEAQYRITMHAPVDVNSAEFRDEIKKLKKATYVFVALGGDGTDISASIKLRTLFEQMGIKPRIQAVVENSERKGALSGIKNFSGQPYDIEYVCAADEIYSYDGIINSELERESLKRHLRWGAEDDFWKYEYNYRSSAASALHARMKKICGVPGAEKRPSERTEEERQIMRRLEHRRWNAYMRSEGYTYAEQRNNLAKTHPCLVTFDLLSQKDKEKDDD